MTTFYFPEKVLKVFTDFHDIRAITNHITDIYIYLFMSMILHENFYQNVLPFQN